jgi:uncharacterized membrane protein
VCDQETSKNEEAKARYRAVKIHPQWVVTPGKQTNNSVVMVPLIWLYITVVVVVISFSIIVSCIFISLLFVTVSIMYRREGNIINVINVILLDGENISFDANLVTYINSTSIPPIIIMNRM